MTWRREPSSHPSPWVRYAPGIATAANVIGLPLSIIWPVAAVQQVAENPFPTVLTGQYRLKSLPQTFSRYLALRRHPEVMQWLERQAPGLFGPKAIPVAQRFQAIVSRPEETRAALQALKEMLPGAPQAEKISKFISSAEQLMAELERAPEYGGKLGKPLTYGNVAALIGEAIESGMKGPAPRQIVANWGRAFFGPAFGTAIGSALLTNLLPYWVDPYEHPYFVFGTSLASIPIGAWSIREMTKPAVEGLSKIAPWTLAGKYGKWLFPLLGGLVGAIPLYQAWAKYQKSKRRRSPIYNLLYRLGL